MHVTDWIAIVALLIALGSLSLSLSYLWRDKYKLRCEGFLRTKITSTGGEQTSRIIVNVTNEGQRPISITRVYYEKKVTTIEPDAPPITEILSIYGGLPNEVHPVELAENQTRRFNSGKIQLQEMLELPPEFDVHVKDSRGRIHRCSVYNNARELAEMTELKELEGP